MKKIAIFDDGWGGERFAEYLNRELNILSIDRIIDWKNFPYFTFSKQDVIRCVDDTISHYVGKYDVIFLANEVCALYSLEYLSDKYHYQKFLSMPYLVESVKSDTAKTILVLTTSNLLKSQEYQKIIDNPPTSANYIYLACDDLILKYNDASFSYQDLIDELSMYDAPDLVLLESSGLYPLKSMIEKYYSWRAQVIDANLLALRDLSKLIGIKNIEYRRLPSIFRKTKKVNPVSVK